MSSKLSRINLYMSDFRIHFPNSLVHARLATETMKLFHNKILKLGLALTVPHLSSDNAELALRCHHS